MTSSGQLANELKDLTGYRGEKIVELSLTDYQAFKHPLFRPGFLGDKWPAVDFYVELLGLRDRKLYFFAQAKSTTKALKSKSITISTKKSDIIRLLQIPGPTYIFGVHEPSGRVFVRSVHTGTPAKAINSIALTHELNSTNLRELYDEVRRFWGRKNRKPSSSAFA